MKEEEEEEGFFSGEESFFDRGRGGNPRSPRTFEIRHEEEDVSRSDVWWDVLRNRAVEQLRRF